SFGGTGPGDGWLSRLGRDARYAVRRLLARPAFAATAVASLALAIGANSAMFTLVNDVILRRPALTHPEELVDLYQVTRDFHYNSFSLQDVEDIRRVNNVYFGLGFCMF